MVDMMKYPDEFKREALKLAAQPGIKVAQVERDLGITPGLIYKWRQRLRVEENSHFAECETSVEKVFDGSIIALKFLVAGPEIITEHRSPASRQRFHESAELWAAGWLPQAGSEFDATAWHPGAPQTRLRGT